MSIFRRRRASAAPTAEQSGAPASPGGEDGAAPTGWAPVFEPTISGVGLPTLHPGESTPAAFAPDEQPSAASSEAAPPPAMHGAPQAPVAPHAPDASPRTPGHAPLPVDGGRHRETEARAPESRAVAVADDAVDDPRVDPAAPAGVEDPVPQVAPVSRSGRNMPVATIVGLLLLGLVLGAAWWHPAAFASLAALACVIAVIEWRRVLARSDRHVPLVPTVLATAGLIVATWFGGPEGLAVALMVGCAGTVAWRVVDERIENTMADSLASMLTLLWIPFLASFLVLMGLATDGWQRVLIVVLAVVGSDTGGLFAGMLLGRHPMAPRVSPKKTWEGFAGGLLLGTAAASVAAHYFFDGRWWIGALIGGASAIAAVLGDLAESALKRDIQVKDMSSVIPGHGGILDRIDSLLFAAPVAYVVMGLLL